MKENARKNYPTIREYLSIIDQTCFEGEIVTYMDDGTIVIKYTN